MQIRVTNLKERENSQWEGRKTKVKKSYVPAEGNERIGLALNCLEGLGAAAPISLE